MAVITPRLLRTGVKLTNKKFRLQMKKLIPKDATLKVAYLVLLKFDGTTAKFTKLTTVYTFGVGWSDFRNAKRFEIASLDAGVEAAMLKVTHVSFNGDVYELGNGDGDAPFFKDYTWKIYARLMQGERYELNA